MRPGVQVQHAALTLRVGGGFNRSAQSAGPCPLRVVGLGWGNLRRNKHNQTNKRTNQQTNKQTNKPTNQQTDERTNKQPNKQTHKQTNKQTNTQTNPKRGLVLTQSASKRISCKEKRRFPLTAKSGRRCPWSQNGRFLGPLLGPPGKHVDCRRGNQRKIRRQSNMLARRPKRTILGTSSWASWQAC